MFISGLGAILFGLIVGWIAYWILRLRAGASMFAELIVFVGVVGGAAAVGLIKSDVVFGWYAIGLVLGFFGYFAVGFLLYGQQEIQPWRIGQLTPPPPPPDPGPPPTTNVPATDVPDAD